MGVVEYVLQSVCSVQFCLLALITCILYYNVRFMKYKLPPRPHGWPVIGNMFASDRGHLHFWCKEQAKECGPIMRYTFGFMQDAVIINDYKNALKTMVDHGKEFEARPRGVVLEEHSEGYNDTTFGDPDQPNWHLRRKLFATSVRNFTNGRPFEDRTMLTFGSIKPILDAKADSGQSFDPTAICKLYLANHIAGICFKKTYDIEDEEFVRMMAVLDNMTQDFNKFHFSDIFPFMNNLPFMMPDRRRVSRTAEPLFRFLRDEIQKHKETFQKDEEPTDLTDYVLKMMSEDDAYSTLTEVEQRQVISDVFIAGNVTSQPQFRWTLVVLASHPEVQERLYRDIIEKMGPIDKDDPDFGVSAIDYRTSIPYIDAFILENTRFGTVGPVGPLRRATCDTTIGGYDVPKGTQVILNQYAVNWSEDEHDKPDEFRPERFLTAEGELGPRPASYMSFGLGRRSCPGETVSRNTLWMTLVMLLRRYQILPPGGQKLVPRYSHERGVFGEPDDFEIMLKYRN